MYAMFKDHSSVFTEERVQTHLTQETVNERAQFWYFAVVSRSLPAILLRLRETT